MSDMPDKPWEKLSVDFCGPLPSGDYLFVITDEFSRYPVLEVTRSTSANATIPVLHKVISAFGIPKVIKSDKGSPFNSAAFEEFAKNIGFHHRRITPRWPRANAQAESFNKLLMKAVRAAHVSKKNWEQELYNFFRQFRNTPHPSTGMSPFTLMFNRETRDKIASNFIFRSPPVVRSQRDEHAKLKVKINNTNLVWTSKVATPS